MKKILNCYICLVLLVLLWPITSFSATQAKGPQVIIGVVDNSSRETFESGTFKSMKEELSACSQCEVVNLTPYNDKGEFEVAKIASQILDLKQDVNLLFFTWNEKVKEAQNDLIAAISQMTQKGVIVISPAGYPPNEAPSAPLNKTLMGKVPNAFIIGELTERDRLLGSSFYGPEMFTAVRPKRGLIGKGLSPMLFATRFAQTFTKRTPQEWIEHLNLKKQKTKKLWLDLDDCFGR